MNKIDKVQTCTGCGACSFICPKECISMKEDAEGFIKPIIDENQCVGCGICYNNCPQVVTVNKNLIPDKVYAFVNLDEQILHRSSSGGAFSYLANYVLEKKGVVFGAAFDENFRVKTISIESRDELNKLQGSKYIESDLGNSFEKVHHFLSEGRFVLFSGTPCQIAGLYATFNKKRPDKLLTVELLCHGVPSNKIFQKYLEIENKKGQILEYSFRDKAKWGWGNWGSYKYLKGNKEKKIYFPVASDYFYSLYFKNNIFRTSCYECHHASIPRGSDVTIGDFWGAEKLLRGFSFKKGISLLMLNNQKAFDLFWSMTNSNSNIKIQEVLLENIIPYNKTIVMPSEKPAARDIIYEELEQYGFYYVGKKYCKISKFNAKIRRYIPRWIKGILKK